MRVSRATTLIFGIIGIILASNVGRIGDLIEISNKAINSFTGPLFGIYVLGMFTCRARSRGVWMGGLLGAFVTACVAFFSDLSFLWPSTFGLLATLVAGYTLSLLQGPAPASQQRWTFKRVMAEAPVGAQAAGR